jgi:5'-methylthioadenosine phosphorylase
MGQKLGVIGGSGLYQMDRVQQIREHRIRTPFGEPSSEILECEIHGQRVFFLPRHGKHHGFLPSEIPYRANISALKSLGVTHLLGVSAVGIMQEGIRPGDMVVPDQMLDQTKGFRKSSFFGEGLTGHMAFGEPFCPEFRKLVARSVEALNIPCHNGGAYLCIEGPRFSSRAESLFYRKAMEPAVIGMTGMPEAILAREAELSYAIVAMGTDYDSWHTDHAAVTVEEVMAVLSQNIARAQDIVIQVAKSMGELQSFPFRGKARRALMVSEDHLPPHLQDRMAFLYGSEGSVPC